MRAQVVASILLEDVVQFKTIVPRHLINTSGLPGIDLEKAGPAVVDWTADLTVKPDGIDGVSLRVLKFVCPVEYYPVSEDEPVNVQVEYEWGGAGPALDIDNAAPQEMVQSLGHEPWRLVINGEHETAILTTWLQELYPRQVSLDFEDKIIEVSF